MSPKRICIIGYSSSGKSTLAKKLGEKYDLPIHHLDIYHHIDGTNWEPKPKEEFIALHDAAIAEDKWVIEGNYSSTMPQRFARADLIIHVRMNRFGCLYRFLCRHFRNQKDPSTRIGSPPNIQEKFNWDMIWWIIQPRIFDKSRRKKDLTTKKLLKEHQNKLKVIRTFKEMENL